MRNTTTVHEIQSDDPVKLAEEIIAIVQMELVRQVQKGNDEAGYYAMRLKVIEKICLWAGTVKVVAQGERQ